MTDQLNLLSQNQPKPLSITDRVYEELYHRIINLALPPGSKLSEAEVASQMGVSRQPVRDAFYRLSQAKLLMVRPQRATIVMPISEEAVHEAIFIRAALELETVRAAIPVMTRERIAELRENLKGQAAACDAGDSESFHTLDEEFHRQICAYSGHEQVWTLIQNNKAHMDRIRYLSLETGNARNAQQDHSAILDAIAAGDEERALEAMRGHIYRIAAIGSRIRNEYAEYFDMSIL
ncbi:MAG: GntR family transcriptional regulator [Gammaproteobacteria bacterium]|nr:GntR family transcriptional regulator [Gammaproteobacteria bacterium]